jgi:hypothetical protein
LAEARAASAVEERAKEQAVFAERAASQVRIAEQNEKWRIERLEARNPQMKAKRKEKEKAKPNQKAQREAFRVAEKPMEVGKANFFQRRLVAAMRESTGFGEKYTNNVTPHSIQQ